MNKYVKNKARKIIDKCSKNTIKDIIKNSPCKSEALRKFNVKPNGFGMKVLNELISQTNADASHFNHKWRPWWEENKEIRREVNCSNCNNNLIITIAELKKSKSGNAFCNRSCAATYNNKNKKYGIRRSKAEKKIENYINKTYPEIEMLCNSKNAIGSELDFYFPQLNIAIEVNGIFHYEPIFGKGKLKKIQANDKEKIKKCKENNIDIYILNMSKETHIKEEGYKKYYNIIDNILI